MHPLPRPVASALAVLGAASYPALLLWVLGTSFSPFAPESTWGLAAEHGELQFEHWSHFALAVTAALPAVISFKFAARKLTFPLLLASSAFAALPYALQPTHSCAASDSWLANYTWQVSAIEVALAPLLAATAIGTLAWLKRRTG